MVLIIYKNPTFLVFDNIHNWQLTEKHFYRQDLKIYNNPTFLVFDKIHNF